MSLPLPDPTCVFWEGRTATHPFGNLAIDRSKTDDPWLCVPASRRVCSVEDEEVSVEWFSQAKRACLALPLASPAGCKKLGRAHGSVKLWHGFFGICEVYGRQCTSPQQFDRALRNFSTAMKISKSGSCLVATRQGADWTNRGVVLTTATKRRRNTVAQSETLS